MKSVQIFENTLIKSEMSNESKILVNELKTEILKLCESLACDNEDFKEDYPEEYFEPTATGIYKDRVFIVIWEPLTSILIKSKSLADSYRKHFKLLWGMGKDIKK